MCECSFHHKDGVSSRNMFPSRCTLGKILHVLLFPSKTIGRCITNGALIFQAIQCYNNFMEYRYSPEILIIARLTLQEKFSQKSYKLRISRVDSVLFCCTPNCEVLIEQSSCNQWNRSAKWNFTMFQCRTRYTENLCTLAYR